MLDITNILIKLTQTQPSFLGLFEALKAHLYLMTAEVLAD
jgi:hypothetical protein